MKTLFVTLIMALMFASCSKEKVAITPMLMDMPAFADYHYEADNKARTYTDNGEPGKLWFYFNRSGGKSHINNETVNWDGRIYVLYTEIDGSNMRAYCTGSYRMEEKEMKVYWVFEEVASFETFQAFDTHNGFIRLESGLHKFNLKNIY